ncbi:hypothetical protein H2199_009223 [Coniosporium tulheliwenetii]|uniref:Uncharacterized protein n=1 Tax=Coniosporium tulheliwenetii TaxID=3383036 RepID=A0ACC2YF83_9PEZI|nr:hypothetical protein H2199_009223 [Cladosporium sp. JES 115]
MQENGEDVDVSASADMQGIARQDHIPRASKDGHQSSPELPQSDQGSQWMIPEKAGVREVTKTTPKRSIEEGTVAPNKNTKPEESAATTTKKKKVTKAKKAAKAKKKSKSKEATETQRASKTKKSVKDKTSSKDKKASKAKEASKTSTVTKLTKAKKTKQENGPLGKPLSLVNQGLKPLTEPYLLG